MQTEQVPIRMKLPFDEINHRLKESGSTDSNLVLIVVADDAHRPLISVSESSWSEVPPLCWHRGRQSSRNLKKRTLISRWGGSEQEAKAKPVQNQQQSPPAVTTNSSKPRRKASMETSTQDINTFRRSRNLCQPMRKESLDMSSMGASLAPLGGLSKPMRKASIEMSGIPMRKASIDMTATSGPSQLPGLRKPMRKASVDMQGCVTADLECLPDADRQCGITEVEEESHRNQKSHFSYLAYLLSLPFRSLPELMIHLTMVKCMIE